MPLEASASATQVPRPPITEWSSTVTSHSTSDAILSRRLVVKRLQAVRVPHRHRDAFGFEQLRGFDRLGQRRARRDAGDAGLRGRANLMQLAGLPRALTRELRQILACEAEIRRALPFLDEIFDHALGLGTVGRLEHAHRRQRTHERDVFESHLAVAVVADADARVGADEANARLRISDAQADRVVAAREEAAEAARERHSCRRTRDLRPCRSCSSRRCPSRESGPEIFSRKARTWSTSKDRRRARRSRDGSRRAARALHRRPGGWPLAIVNLLTVGVS